MFVRRDHQGCKFDLYDLLFGQLESHFYNKSGVYMFTKAIMSCITCLFLVFSISVNASDTRERLSLDQGWLFHLGDIPFPEVKGHGASYNNAKAGNAGGAAATEFDDSDWRRLDLPHDWAVEGPFDPNANLSQGYRPRGVSWYRRYLRVDETDRGRHFELQFDAIATHSSIWINGNIVNRNWSGYNASYIDITPYLRYGDALNTIAIRVDANVMEGWWYEGAGIYRHSWLVKRNPVHIVTDGVHATPQEIKKNNWEIPVAVTLYNSGKSLRKVSVMTEVFDPQGKKIASGKAKTSVDFLNQATALIPLKIKNPRLWSLEQTNLYRIETRVFENGNVIDETSLNTGFRRIRFDATNGFFLNDQHVKLQGVCIHQDHAGVGVAVPDSIWEYRLRRLKELGVNAIRFAHNAPAAEVLDMVDRMGFVVMDENRNFNPSPDYMKQLEWMVRRDRHHPSIVLWSVFNEEPVQDSEVGYEMVRRMVAAVKQLDTTRPVTAAMNGGLFTDINVSHAVDVLGVNYQVLDYDRYHNAHPQMPFTSSEDTSAFMTRGEFLTDKTKNVIASYDDDFAPWGNSHRDAWQAIATRDYIAGGFVWTGFDYRGEPTPNEWPSVSSAFGIMDLNGFPKTAYFMHQVQWIKNRPLIYIAPHWNWQGKEGQEIRVMVMTNADRIKLLLNGRELAEQKTDHFRMNFFNVKYEKGQLEAVAFNGDKDVARSIVETTGDAVTLELIPDREKLKGNGKDAMPITVRALDARGRAVPTVNSEITFSISGAGKSIGHGNGDPNSHEDEKGKTRKLFNGLAQLIVQSNVESSGTLKVVATSPGLTSATIEIPVESVAPIPSVNTQDATSLLYHWRVSPASVDRPDPLQKVADNDMNSWGWGQVPVLEFPPKTGANKNGTWRLYRGYFYPRKDLASGHAQIRFKNIIGKAEVWLDEKLLAKKSNFAGGELVAPLPIGQKHYQINVLVEGDGQEPSGFKDLVLIENVGLK